MEPIIPSDRVNTSLPLYAAFGLSEAESNAVFFSVTEDFIPTKKTVAECLIAIAERKGWSEKQKMWAAYNLRAELLVARGIPRSLMNTVWSV